MDRLALIVLEERDGLTLPDGSVFATNYIHRRAYEDTPVRDMTRRELRRKVIDFALEEHISLNPDDVAVAEVSPDELTAAWREHAAPMDSPPLTNAHVLVGYWTPSKEK